MLGDPRRILLYRDLDDRGRLTPLVDVWLDPVVNADEIEQTQSVRSYEPYVPEERLASAKDEVARLQAEIERLRAAMAPFDRVGVELFVTNHNAGDKVLDAGRFQLTAGDFFHLRAALAAPAGSQEGRG